MHYYFVTKHYSPASAKRKLERLREGWSGPPKGP